MRPVRYSGRFRKDFRRIERRKYDLNRLDEILLLRRQDDPLPPSARPHPLKGAWRNYSECHVAPDWLLIYKLVGEELLLAATGTHADLFDE